MSSTTSAPTNAAAVANTFLVFEQADTDTFPAIDQMKIQKLTFYSHAWWLAKNNCALFDEDIEAWPWGPVVRELYGQFRGCGRSAIGARRAQLFMKTGDGPLDFRYKVPDTPSEDVVSFLKSVWESHKQFSGIRLSNATHAPGEPWTIIKEQHGNLDEKPRIPNELIQDVFKRKIPA